MEAAELYAFATASHRPVLCIAHVTGRLGGSDGDPEEAEADGVRDALRVIEAILRRVDPFGDPCHQCGQCGRRDSGVCVRDQLRHLLR
jgi:hypothetical protein